MLGEIPTKLAHLNASRRVINYASNRSGVELKKGENT